LKAEDGKSKTNSEIVRPDMGILPLESEETGTGDTPLDESEEAQEAQGIKREDAPSAKEVEEHERTHAKYRSWCKHCVF